MIISLVLLFFFFEMALSGCPMQPLLAQVVYLERRNKVQCLHVLLAPCVGPLSAVGVKLHCYGLFVSQHSPDSSYLCAVSRAVPRIPSASAETSGENTDY